MKRMLAAALMLLMLVPGVARAVGEEPVQLNMSLSDFISQYNSQEGVTTKIESAQDHKEQVFGIVYMPADELVDVFVKLAYDSSKDRVLHAGCSMDKDVEPDFEGFLAVADHVMAVVFDGMDADARRALLMRAILEGEEQGSFAPTRRERSFEARSGDCVVKYIVNDENARQVIAYKVQAGP